MNGPAPILASTVLAFDGFKGQIRDPSNDMPAYSDAVLSDKDVALCEIAAGGAAAERHPDSQ